MNDPIRYSAEDMPTVGATVYSPNGRLFKVINVVGSHKVVCEQISGNDRVNDVTSFQANDLRKVGSAK